MPKKKKRRKVVRKTASKARKAVRKGKGPGRKAVKPRSARGRPKLSPEKQVPGGIFLGIAEDYFSHVGAVALKLKAPLTVGERIRVKGHTTDLTQEVSSLQIDRLPVERAKKGDSVGILVSARARRGDAVYKV